MLKTPEGRDKMMDNLAEIFKSLLPKGERTLGFEEMM